MDLLGSAITINPENAATISSDLENLFALELTKPQDSLWKSYPKGVILSNGSLIAGEVKWTDEPTIKVGAFPIPKGAIAIVFFTPLERDKLPAEIKGRTGAFLSNGDFLVGSVIGCKATNVTVDSPILGRQQVQAAGMILQDLQDVSSRYVVIHNNGSRFLVDDVKFDPDGAVLSDSLLGEIKIPKSDLSGLRAGTKRYLSLVGVKPARVDVAVGATSGKAVQIQAPDNPNDEGSVLSAAGAALTYEVPAGMTIFASRVAIPKDAPAGTRVTFNVYADGRFLFRSPTVEAGPKPLPIRVNMGPVRSLSIRVEPVAPQSAPAFGQWVEPRLQRR